MYYSLVDAYGSAMSESNSSEKSYESENKSVNLKSTKKANHKYYIENFLLLKELTVSELHKLDKLMLFNEIFDHINNCYSCKLYLDKKKYLKQKKLSEKKNVYELKDIAIPLFTGLFLIIMIVIIIKVSKKK